VGAGDELYSRRVGRPWWACIRWTIHPLGCSRSSGFLNHKAAIIVGIRWYQGLESPMGLQAFGVSKPWGRHHRVAEAKCGGPPTIPCGFSSLQGLLTLKSSEPQGEEPPQGDQSPAGYCTLRLSLPWGYNASRFLQPRTTRCKDSRAASLASQSCSAPWGSRAFVHISWARSSLNLLFIRYSISFQRFLPGAVPFNLIGRACSQ